MEHFYDSAAPSPHTGCGDVAVVVCGERPYAEWPGDVADFSALVSPADVQLVLDVRASAPNRPLILVLFCGRPLPLADELWHAADAILVAWWPGTEGSGVVDVLCGKSGATGKLPIDWPAAGQMEPAEHCFRRGYGLETQPWPVARRS